MATKLIRWTVVVTLVMASVACGGVQARRAAPARSGFLQDYSNIRPTKGYELHETSVAPDANWSDYDTVMIGSIISMTIAEAL